MPTRTIDRDRKALADALEGRQVTPKPGPWLIELDYIPPSINHSHGNKQGGGRYRKKTTTDIMGDITDAADSVGFMAMEKRFYSVRIAYTLPTWGNDIDNRIKPLLDAIFGPRHDHRIVHLEATKAVKADTNKATILIQDVAGDYWADDAARLRRVIGRS